jgi:hypothetical protein
MGSKGNDEFPFYLEKSIYIIQMSSNYGFSPTLDGLNNIDADSSTTTNIICDTIQVNTSSSVPTRIAGDNTTNIANTAFVTNAVSTAGANYVDKTTTQTISGQKTFSNANTFITGNLVAPTIKTTSGTSMSLTTTGFSDNISITAGQDLNLTSGYDTVVNSYRGTYSATNTLAFTTNGSMSFTDNFGGAVGINFNGTNIFFNNSGGATTFYAVPSCSIAPTTANHLCNKTYVDSVATGASLSANNTFTGSNIFLDPVYVKNPSASKSMTLKTTNGNITMSTGATNQANTGSLFYCNTLTVPANNSEDLLTITIPFNVNASGGNAFYPGGTLNITYTSVSVNVLKNGSSYSGSTPTATIYNTTSLTKTWTVGGTTKPPVYRAYLGNFKIPIALDIQNASTDTYDIGLTINATYTYTFTPTYTFNLFVSTTGYAFFTTTNTNNDGGTFSGTNPPYVAYAKLIGDDGSYLTSSSKLSLTGTSININGSIDSITEYGNDVNFNGSKFTLNTGQWIFKTSGTEKLTFTSNSDNVAIKTTVAGDFINFTASDDTSAFQIQDSTANGQYQKADVVIPDTTGFTLIPAGTIITFAGSTAPTGYLLCNGASLSSTNVATNPYRRLFDAIGYTYGGSGASFNIPNTQGLFVSSAGSQTLNSVAYSRTLGARQNDTVEDHKHTYSDMMWWDTDTGGGSGQTIYVSGADYQAPGGDTVGSNGDGNFSNRLTKATYPSTAVNPGTPAQQWNAPTNVSAITGTETFPANIAFNHYIKY